jgi:hypothetical protein
MSICKFVLDDIEKDDTDVTGQKEVMGGSVQVENQFSHDDIDENANDQSKHQLDPKIGTENPKGPESECKDVVIFPKMYQVTIMELLLFLHKRVLLMKKVMNI